jgi:ATP-dependent Clp protease ATP-binding subunit ClpX
MSETMPTLHCNFCGSSSDEVKKLIAGPDNVYICDECIQICYLEVSYSPSTDVVETSAEAVKEPEAKLPTPTQIRDHLRKYIVGQDDALVSIAVAVYDHYKRLRTPASDDVEIEKSNILLVGPTGSGKTLIAQSIAKLLDVPFAIADATSLTEAGYVGDDVESIITRLLDEIDKKARRGETASGSRDVAGEGVQQALLKIIEGSDIMVPAQGPRKGSGTDLVKINTRNILFILGGAFVGIEKIVEASLNATGSIGFGATKIGRTKDGLNTLLSKVEAEHVQKFGLIPELVGRLPVISVLSELDEEQLVHVMTKTKNSVTKQFEKMFKIDGVTLEFDDAALRVIAKTAKDRKTGARGLRSVIERRLRETKFNLPEMCADGLTRVIVSEDRTDTSGIRIDMIYDAAAPTPMLAISN